MSSTLHINNYSTVLTIRYPNIVCPLLQHQMTTETTAKGRQLHHNDKTVFGLETILKTQLGAMDKEEK
jgi:hypothetical protein